MFKKVSYDQIYDEHIYMFSASSVSKIFKRFDFGLVDAIPQNTHGGSMRYIIKKKTIISLKILKTLLIWKKKNKFDRVLFKI